MTDNDDDDWGAYRRHILATLEVLAKDVAGLRAEVGQLRDRIQYIEGKASTWGIVSAAVGLIGLILGYIFALIKGG